MATAQRNATEVTVSIDDFRNLAQKTKDELLPPSIGSEAFNLRFNEEYGSIEKRLSRAKYAGMSSLGTFAIKHADRYYKNSNTTKTLIIAYDTFLKTGNDSTGVFSNIKTGLTTGLRWKSLTFKDLWYGCNGTDSPQVYNGSVVETMGVPTPASAPSVATGAAGVLTGNYQYKVTFEIDSYQEGNASSASAVVAPISQKIELSAIPTSTNSRVTARNIYRTQTGGTIYYFLTRIADNTTTVYSDNNADGVLDTTITAPSDYGTPPAFKFMCLHKSRIFGLRYSGNLSRAIYSDIRSGASYPDVFPVDNIFDVLKDNGEEGTVIIEDQFGQLIVMKPSAVVKINTDTDDPVGWSGFSNVLSVNGCISPYSACKTPLGIFYVTLYGEHKKRLMLWNGQSVTPVFEELEPVLSAIIGTRVPEIVAEYFSNSLYISYSDPDSGNIFNDRIIIIDLITGSWMIDKKNAECFSKWTAGTDSGELYTGTSDSTGFVYREDTNIQDLIIRFKSEIDLGTIDFNLTSQGTEVAPVLIMNSGVSDDIGTKIVSTLTVNPDNLVSGYTSDDETVSPSGQYTSPVLEVNAKNLVNAYWTETLGLYGFTYIYIRTGATIAATTAAAWSGPFLTSSGSDISSVTANRYIQYRLKAFIDGDFAGTNYSDVYFSRGSSPNDFVVKIAFGLGSISETAIEMVYLSSWMDFGWVRPEFKRLRKHFRQVKIEFERTLETGTLTFGYQLDGSGTRTDTDFLFSTYATRGYCIYKFPISTYAKKIKYRLYQNDDVSSLKITAVHWSFTVEPKGDIL